jgi:hypothetical protein
VEHAINNFVRMRCASLSGSFEKPSVQLSLMANFVPQI